MSLKITLKADQNNLNVQIPHAEFSEEKRNLMAVDPSNNMVVDIGENQAEFTTNFPDIWDKHKDNIKFVNPFDFDTHGVNFAHALLWHYALVARKEKSGSIILPRKTEPIEFDLWIEDYETQSPKLRQKFEYILVKEKQWAVKKLNINGKKADIETTLAEMKTKRKRASFIEWPLWINILVWFTLFLFGANLLADGASIATGIAVLDIILVSLIFAIFLVLSVVLGTVTWALIARRFLPIETIEKYFPKRQFLKNIVISLLRQLNFFDSQNPPVN